MSSAQFTAYCWTVEDWRDSGFPRSHRDVLNAPHGLAHVVVGHLGDHRIRRLGRLCAQVFVGIVNQVLRVDAHVGHDAQGDQILHQVDLILTGHQARLQIVERDGEPVGVDAGVAAGGQDLGEHQQRAEGRLEGGLIRLERRLGGGRGRHRRGRGGIRRGICIGRAEGAAHVVEIAFFQRQDGARHQVGRAATRKARCSDRQGPRRS